MRGICTTGLMACGRGWVGDTPGFNGDVNAALGSIKAKTLFIVSPQDQFFPPHYIEADVKAIPNARAVWIDSVAGHLICCNADPNATRRMGDAIREFLRELSAPGTVRSRGGTDMRATRSLDPERRHLLARSWRDGSGSGCLGLHGRAVAADPPPEIKKIRLLHVPAICHAPQYLAEELLHLEGITEVEYVPFGTRYIPEALATSKADMSMWNAMEFIPYMDANKPIVVLAGIHAGCFEVFGNERVRSIRDLKGKTVAIMYFGGGDHILLSSMLAYVGIEPQRGQLDAWDRFSAGCDGCFRDGQGGCMSSDLLSNR